MFSVWLRKVAGPSTCSPGNASRVLWDCALIRHYGWFGQNEMDDGMTSKMNSHPGLTHRRIGFVSTRFAGTDGVSLETEKWAAVLERLSHTCFYFAGQCDRPAERSRVVPAASFEHP